MSNKHETLAPTTEKEKTAEKNIESPEKTKDKTLAAGDKEVSDFIAENENHAQEYSQEAAAEGVSIAEEVGELNQTSDEARNANTQLKAQVDGSQDASEKPRIADDVFKAALYDARYSFRYGKKPGKNPESKINKGVQAEALSEVGRFYKLKKFEKTQNPKLLAEMYKFEIKNAVAKKFNLYDDEFSSYDDVMEIKQPRIMKKGSLLFCSFVVKTDIGVEYCVKARVKSDGTAMYDFNVFKM